MVLNFKKVGDGEPLIILHGLFGSLDNWLTLAKKLGNHFEVYLVDARNHGQSPHSEEFNYDVMADDIYEFLMHHNIVDPIILGHSMGGKTAMQFAMNYPTQLTKLIVADIAPKPYPVHHNSIITGMCSLNFNEIKTRKGADEQLSKHINDASTRQFLLKNLYWENKNQLAWRMNLDVLIKKMNEILIQIPSEICLTPTLFLRGEKSNYILEEEFEQLYELFPNAEIETIYNAGHWLHTENPLDFYQQVIYFMA